MTGVVLAGGKSSRMGESKPGIVLGGMTLLERAVEKLRPIFPRIIIVASPDDDYSIPGAEIINDRVPGYGSLMGIYTALMHARESIFAVACDMPFINIELIGYMIEHSDDWDVVVPRPGEHYEPLHAIYSPACIPFMEELINKDARKIIDFYPRARVLEIEEDVLKEFDPEGISFFNINSPEDLARAEKEKR
jgi:molybdopterin-guanine dinucleotide biosynthesis protein A